ncbi:MAG: ATP-binding protein [Bacteroidales bacterium]
MKCRKKLKIAVASGKGGVGKTFVATNLVFALNDDGYRVSLVDCDAEEPNAKVFFDAEVEKLTPVMTLIPHINEKKCVFCGKCYEYCNYNAIFYLPELKTIKVLDDLCHSCGACTVACVHDAITENEKQIGKVSHYKILKDSYLVESCMNVGVYSPVPVINKAIQSLECDISVFDAPPGTSCPFIHTVSNSDFVVLVTEPTPFGLSDLKQSVETLRQMNKPCGVIINRAGIGDNGVANFLKKENIPLLLEIPFDKEISYFYSWGELIVKDRPELKAGLLKVFKYICDKYGNSCN